MNLVQIQERLKDAPTQAIMQYANGGNPMVPPYLALAELQRRDSMNKSAANQQALAQGAQPSVKEQVEQAAGLAALQKQTQAKGLQSLMGAGVPVPSVPTPERQPEAEGVAALPTNEMYNFAEGGIIGYAGGGLPDVESGVIPIEQLEREYERALRAGKPVQANAILDVIKARKQSAPRTINVPVAEMDAAPEKPAPEMAPPPARRLDNVPPPGGLPSLALPEARQGMMPSGAPEGDMPSSAGQQPPMRQAGIAALPGADEASRIITGLMKQPTPEQSISTEREFAKAYGIDQPYGAERMKRIQEMQAQRQQMLEPRGTERLMRVLGGIAGRGLQGAGPAYLQAIEGERASDMDFRNKMDELMAGTEEKQRADLTAGAERARKQFGTDQELQLGAAEKIFAEQQKQVLKQAELEFRRLEMKVSQQQRLTPREQFLVNYAGGNFEKYLEGVRKVSESEQGPRTETSRAKEMGDAQADYRKAMSDPISAAAMERQGVKTLSDFLKKFYPQFSQDASTNDPLMSKADSILAGRK